MNSRCMHVDLLLKVPGLCQFSQSVLCCIVQNFSRTTASRHMWDLEKEKKWCLSMFCFCATWTRNNNQVETLFTCTIEINYNEQQNCGDTLLYKILFLSVFIVRLKV